MSIDRSWLAIGLGLSLLANVFLVGIEAGHSFTGQKEPASPGGSRMWIQRRLIPPEERKQFAEVMRRHRDAIDADRKLLRDAHDAAEAAITPPTYDRAKADAAFAAIRRASDASQVAVQSALVEALATLSPETRAKLFAHR